MAARKRIGRPPGKTHPEAFILRLPEGTLKIWHESAEKMGVTVAEMVRNRVAWADLLRSLSKKKKSETREPAARPINEKKKRKR